MNDKIPRKEIPEEEDMAGGSLPSVTLSSDSQILAAQLSEKKLYYFFKIAVFGLVTLLSAWILCSGIVVTKEVVKHISNIQNETVQIAANSSRIPRNNNQPESSLADAKSKSDKTLKETEKDEDKNHSNGLDALALSFGSIVTLIIILFGVGLTLLLSLMKFTFQSQQKDERSEAMVLASPISELLIALTNWVKHKIK